MFQKFNLYIWHSLWILVPLGTIVFIAAYRRAKKGLWYFFDPKHYTGIADSGDFGPHYARYQDIAKLAITLSAGAIAFLINTLVGQKAPLEEFAARIESVAPIVVGFFAASISFLILFMVLLSMWYEDYCHSKTHDTYTAWRYGTVQALGVIGLISFLLAFIWLGANIFG